MYSKLLENDQTPEEAGLFEKMSATIVWKTNTVRCCHQGQLDWFGEIDRTSLIVVEIPKYEMLLKEPPWLQTFG